MQADAPTGRVLVVDGGTLAQHVKGDGWPCERVTTPAEALDKLKAQPFEAVVLDLAVSGAPELLQTLKASSELHHLPVIVAYSPEVEAQQAIEALESGGDDYLAKPVQPGLVGPRLRMAVERHHRAEQERQLHDQVRRLAHELDVRIAEVQKLNRMLAEAALVDGVTGLPNRRATLVSLRQNWALANRHGQAMSCLMVDVDRMKAVNEKYGSEFGDAMLRALAHRIQQAVRISDIIGQYAEEEFVVLCPDTSVNDAFLCAERVRLAVAHLPFEHGDVSIHVTVSIGVSEKRELDADPQQMLRAANDALNAAKHAGRNRVMVAPEDGSSIRLIESFEGSAPHPIPAAAVLAGDLLRRGPPGIVDMPGLRGTSGEQILHTEFI